jgi:hypothetical protein
MHSQSEGVEYYKEHSGTIKIAGGTVPRRAGWCAFCLLRQGVTPIEFMCIGANANQQATKSMGVFRWNVLRAEEFPELDVAFQPLLFKTPTMDKQSQTEKDKSVTVWRTCLVERPKI